MKKKILNIILIVIIVMIVSITTTYATNYLYNSNEVYYDNTNSNITSSDVQGAIDELYTEATNYSSINTRVTSLESYFQNNPTSYFNDDQILIGKDSTASSNWKELIIYHNNYVRSRLYYEPSKDRTVLSASDSSGTNGQGTLVLSGNPVTINGTDIQNDNISSTNSKITLPYTTQKSGFVCLYINPKTDSGGNAIVEVGSYTAYLASATGSGQSSCYPVAKGETISLDTNNNVTLKVKFRSFK